MKSKFDKIFDVIVLAFVLVSMICSLVMFVSAVIFTINDSAAFPGIVLSGLMIGSAGVGGSYFYVDIASRKNEK